MSEDRGRRVYEIYERAMHLTGQAQEAFLVEACDEGLREEVDALLRAAQAADEAFFLNTSATAVFQEGDLQTVAPGRCFGNYRIIKLLGRGGMGEVYLAGRTDLEMQVALKLVRVGTADGFKRFQREREILASLKHPHIATLFDAGGGEEGVPYSVMEYVAGDPIDQYCRAKRLTVRERLELFLKVCDAVSFAHRNLVIHRDIKPANILVTQDGVPKLLDFGISGLLDPETSAGQTETTSAMTPAYASPEQLSGKRLTAASDLYSLGVLLYELLVGHTPFQKNNPMEFYRQMREERVTLPSHAARRLEQAVDIAGERAVSPAVLCRRLRGDVDNILARALEKEPERRYRSVEAFAADIERHLAGMPILAGSAGFAYRTRKFIRRNTWPLVTTAAFVVMLVGFSLSVVNEQRNTARERDLARMERDSARQVVAFLSDTFKVSNPDLGRGRAVTAVELLDRGAQRIEADLTEQPGVQARLMAVMGGVYRNLGLYDEAKPLLEKAMEQNGALGDEAEIQRNRVQLGLLLRDQGDYPSAERVLRLAYENLPAQGEDPYMRANVINGLGLVLQQQGKYDEAEGLFRQMLALVAQLDKEHEAGAVNNLGLLLKDSGRYAEAEPFLRDALALHREMHGENHPAVATSLNNLGLLLKVKGDLAGAESYWRQTLDLRRTLYDADHPKVMTSINNLGAVLKDKGDLSAAEPLFREALTLKRARLGKQHPRLIVSLNNLASLLTESRKLAEADRLFVEADEVIRAKLKPDHLFRFVVDRNWALLRLRQGRSLEAFQLAESAVEGLKRKQKSNSLHLMLARAVLGAAHLANGRPAEAEPLLLESFAYMDGEERDFPTHRVHLLDWLIQLYETMERPEEAARYRGLRGTPR